MSTQADISVEEGVAHIALNTGGSARLTTRVLRQISEALETVVSNDAVDCVVLLGKSGFPSGMTDPRADGDDTDNLLAETCNILEQFPKPVIGVLSGNLVGGGAELALACHYRLVHGPAKIGFPHARMGLMPHAGATQRLPRLLGAAPTLELLLNGPLFPFSEPQLAPLVDSQFDSDPYNAVVNYIASLRETGMAPRPTSGRRIGFADAQGYQAVINKARETVQAAPETAPKHILSAVEAALVLPMEAGLAFEDAAYEDCVETLQSHALTHIFRAERAASTRHRGHRVRDMRRVAVLGGSGFAVQFVMPVLEAGAQVNWVIQDPAQQRDSIGRVHAFLQQSVLQGRLSAEKVDECKAALMYGADAEMAEDVDIALRAARGQRGVALPPDVPVAHCLPGTDPRLAIRFGAATMSPRLIEIVLGPDHTDTDRDAALGFARKLEMMPVVQTTDGPCLSDRLRQTLWRAADALVDLGQSPYAIDAAMRAWGIETPPYRAADVTGLAMVARDGRHVSSTNWSGALLQHGRDGMASGRGIYSYPTPDDSQEDQTVLDLLNSMRPAKPDLPHSQIQQLLIGAIANAGANALREGVVPRASDIDVVSVFAGLIPRWRGGILHAVKDEGLLQVTHAMSALGHPDTETWTPDPIFAELIKNGRGFDAL